MVKENFEFSETILNVTKRVKTWVRETVFVAGKNKKEKGMESSGVKHGNCIFDFSHVKLFNCILNVKEDKCYLIYENII